MLCFSLDNKTNNMAFKFNNPWGGGGSQNPWDINGAEAQKVLGISEIKSPKNIAVAPPPGPSWYIDTSGNVLGSEANPQNSVILVTSEADKATIRVGNVARGNLVGEYFYMPSFEERTQMRITHDAGVADITREYAMYSLLNSRWGVNPPPMNYAYIFFTGSELFQYPVREAMIHGSVQLDRESITNTIGTGSPTQRRFIAHTHNYDTQLAFPNELEDRDKPPSAGDLLIMDDYLGGIVFDTENQDVYIHKRAQRVVPKMTVANFFKRYFANEI